MAFVHLLFPDKVCRPTLASVKHVLNDSKVEAHSAPDSCFAALIIPLMLVLSYLGFPPLHNVCILRLPSRPG